MALPKTLTTVTTFSKILAALFFILFPFVGFYFGMQYQALLDKTNQQSSLNTTTEKPNR